jgi:hypothetical protein
MTVLVALPIVAPVGHVTMAPAVHATQDQTETVSGVQQFVDRFDGLKTLNRSLTQDHVVNARLESLRALAPFSAQLLPCIRAF